MHISTSSRNPGAFLMVLHIRADAVLLQDLCTNPPSSMRTKDSQLGTFKGVDVWDVGVAASTRSWAPSFAPHAKSGSKSGSYRERCAGPRSRAVRPGSWRTAKTSWSQAPLRAPTKDSHQSLDSRGTSKDAGHLERGPCFDAHVKLPSRKVTCQCLRGRRGAEKGTPGFLSCAKASAGLRATRI